MIKLIFNPYYDRGAWTPDPGQGICDLGQKHVGPTGLIDELSMRLGLTGLDRPQHEILCSWYKTIKAVTEEADPFYKESFEIEPLAVAERLLQWRDALVMCGWTPETVLPEGLSSNAVAIMEELGALEQSFRTSGCRTFSDKVREVIRTIPGSGIMPMELESVIPYDALEPVWRTVTYLLKEEGWKVTFPEKGKKLPENIEVKRFKDYVDACMWVALNRPQDLVICSDAAPLDWTLRALGKPTAGSESSASNHQIPHLFVDLMQLCCPKYHLSNVVSYLNACPHPLDQFKDAEGRGGLRHKLLDHIKRQGGLGTNEISGKSFDDILNQYVTGDASVEDIKVWLPFVNSCTDIDCDHVIKLVKALGKWAKGKEEGKQLGQICDAFVSILDLLGYKGKHIGPEELKKLSDYSYRPQKVSLHRKEVGAMKVAPGVDTIAAPVEAAVWMDPVPSKEPYPYAFLSDADVEKLKEVMDIPTRRTLLVQSRESVNASLSNVRSLTMVLCDKVGTEIPAKHQILVGAIGKDEIPYVKIDESSLVHDELRDPRTQKLQHDLGVGFFDGRLGKPLSPSSLEKLLERPFDYAMSYLMGLWDDSSSNESATLGNVAHYVFESIYNKAKDANRRCTAAQFEEVFNKEYESIFAAAVKHCGLELNQPENEILCRFLKTQLQMHSIPTWIGLMKDNGLSIVGSELDVSGTITCPGHKTEIALKARLDLLLQDEEGNYVIFDLKYHGNSGRDKRYKQVKGGKDYQLVMYRALVEKRVQERRLPAGEVRAVGFYMLATSELLTAYPFIGGEEIKSKCGYEKSLDALFTAYEEVMENLRNGILVEGEDMYTEVTDSKGNTKLKKIKDNSFDENRILKGKLN